MSRRYPATLRLLIALITAGITPLRAAITSEDKLVADGPALLREWLPPVYPAAELKARQSGMVNVSFIVDETGRVTAARALEESDAAFIEPALAAVKSWSFTPALEDGQPVACGLETLVAFSPAIGQQKKSKGNIPPEEQALTLPRRVSPSATVTPPGNYPDVLVERKSPASFDSRVS